MRSRFKKRRPTPAGSKPRPNTSPPRPAQSRAKPGGTRPTADVAAAKESLLVAKADRDQAKVWFDYREIRAPYDGVVTLRNVHTGHFLQASSSGSTNKSAEPIFNVVRMDIAAHQRANPRI